MKKKTFIFICLLFLLGVNGTSEEMTTNGNRYIKVDATTYFKFVEDVKQLEIKAHDLYDLNKSLQIECDRLAKENSELSDNVQYAQIQNHKLKIALCISIPVAIGVGCVSATIWNYLYELRK